jgi:hypothetical protein
MNSRALRADDTTGKGMATTLLVGLGLFWSLTYVLIIRQGFRDRTYGMPLVALCANLSWEFIFAVVRPPSGLSRVIVVVWLGFDLVIGYTAVRFGRQEFAYLSRSIFFAGCVGTLALSYLGVDLFSRQFDAGRGNMVAFASNLMMSTLFIGMLIGRRGPRGQSPAIAAAKLLGTGFASLYTWQIDLYPHVALMPYLYVANLVVDAAYLAALLAVGRERVAASTDDVSGQVVGVTR